MIISVQQLDGVRTMHDPKGIILTPELVEILDTATIEPDGETAVINTDSLSIDMQTTLVLTASMF